MSFSSAASRIHFSKQALGGVLRPLSTSTSDSGTSAPNENCTRRSNHRAHSQREPRILSASVPPPPQLIGSSWEESLAVLPSLSYDWLLAKVPRGFQDFFPKDEYQPKHGEDAETNTTSGESSEKTTSKPDGEKWERLSAKDKKKDEHKKQNDSRKKGQKTPPNDDTANLPGLLALLALIVTLRQWLEQEERDMGTEITFVDFRNTLLHTGMVEKLEVINKKMARVVLKPNAKVSNVVGVNEPGLHNNSISSENWSSSANDNTQMAFETTAGSSNTTNGLTASPNSNGKKEKSFYFFIGSVESLEEKLTKAQAHVHPEDWVEVQYMSRTNWTLELLKSLPMVAFVAAVYFGSRGLSGIPGAGAAGRGGGAGGIFSIGKSTAKKITKEDVSVTFADVAGCQQAKMEIMEFVDFLQNSERFTKLGAKIPKGALLCGPPGTGKTLLAKAVAGESGVPFYSISGSDFIEMFVGVGPSRVRDLFKEARANAPCIVFIDEIDAVGRQRGRGGFSGGNDERENTLNQLLVEMDGFSPTTGVVVLAGTNRADILDQALTRPGRFDRQITVDRPDLQGRKEIFEVHLRGIKLEGEVKEYAGRLAGLTPGFAGADIANICNEAAIVAARRKAESVTIVDFETATDRIIGGLESNKIMSTEERSIVAHHEAGHAVAGWFLEHADPLLKVTIIPRTSGALGFAQYLPREVFLRSQEQIMDLVCMALAGRAAEEVFFGRVTTGASDDLRRVTQLVYSTIKDYGMNSRVGQLSFPRDDNAGPGEKRYSDSTAEAMDDEARAIVDEAYQRTVDLMTEKKAQVEMVANLLLEKETITHDDLVDLIGARPFQGDSAYQEYVSGRGPMKKKEPQEEIDNTELDGVLTPGLA